MLSAEGSECQADHESARPRRWECAAMERLEALLRVRAASCGHEEFTRQLADGFRGQLAICTSLCHDK